MRKSESTPIEKALDIIRSRIAREGDAEGKLTWCRVMLVGLLAEEAAEFSALEQTIIDQDKQINQLLAWKKEAISVTPDFQEIGRLMDLKIGESVHDKIVPWIRDAKAKMESLKNDYNEVREQLDWFIDKPVV